MSSRRRRPFGVKAIVSLLLVASVIELASGVANMRMTLQGQGSVVVPPSLPVLRQLWMLVLPLALGCARLIAAVGLVRLKRWAWVLVMLITGGHLVADLWLYFAAGDRPYEAMLLNVAIVFYLNQREVQRTFGQRVPHYRLLDAPVQEAP